MALPPTANLAIERIMGRQNRESQNARKPPPAPSFLAKSNTCSGQISPIDQAFQNSSRATPDFELPPPERLRVMRVLQEGLLQGITDHRRAVQSYAASRGLDIAWTDGSAALSAPGLSLNINFDALGRVGEIAGSLHAV